MQSKDLVFTIIFFIIIIMQCSKVLLNAKRSIRYDSGFSVLDTLGVILVLGFISSRTRGYVILLYNIILIFLLLFVYQYQLRTEKTDDLSDIKKTIFWLILIFMILTFLILAINKY